MAIQAPPLTAQALGTMGTIPFWDLSALQTVSSKDPLTGQQSDLSRTQQATAPGIWTCLPENPNDPWPENVSIWNTIKLGGMRSPGVIQLTGGRAKRIDANKVPGASGYMPSYMGYDAGEFEIKVTIWTPKQFVWLLKFLNVISPPPSAKIQPRAVKADHPGLAMIQVYDVFVHKLGIPQISDHGSLEMIIYAAEFLPPLYAQTGPIQPGYEVINNPDGTQTVNVKPLPVSPAVNSIGP